MPAFTGLHSGDATLPAAAAMAAAALPDALLLLLLVGCG
jgi:hypothetical protein